MKLLLKLSIFFLLLFFISCKFTSCNEKQKDPFLHKSCKLAFLKKMGGEPCNLCLSRQKEENERIQRLVFKKWEKVRGKKFDPNNCSNEEMVEMLQILMNHGIYKVYNEKL